MARQELSGRNDGHNLSYQPQYNAYKLVVEEPGKIGDVAISESWHKPVETAAKRFTLSCYARAVEPGQTFLMEMTFRLPDGSTQAQRSTPCALSKDYTAYTVDLNKPPAYEQFQVRLVAGAEAGTRFFDYVKLSDCPS